MIWGLNSHGLQSNFGRSCFLRSFVYKKPKPRALMLNAGRTEAPPPRGAPPTRHTQSRLPPEAQKRHCGPAGVCAMAVAGFLGRAPATAWRTASKAPAQEPGSRAGAPAPQGRPPAGEAACVEGCAGAGGRRAPRSLRSATRALA